MIPDSLSFWDQIQLTLLRMLTIALGLVDALFNVHLGEHLLDRLVNRWQARLGQIEEAMTALELERERIQKQAEALAIHTAAIYLGGRILVHDQLVFDPADPREEEILDASIELLVKERLAAIETREIEPGRYVYHLEPDWAAICARLAEATAGAEPEMADWLCEGLEFIDEAIM